MPSQYDPNQSPKFTQATRLLQQQKFVEAIALLESLTKDKPNVGEYWLALGIAHEANQQVPAALAPLEKACQASPRPLRACYYFGRTLQSLGRHAEAVSAFELTAKGSEDSQMLTAKAQSYEILGNQTAADLAFRAALVESALRPNNSAAIQLRYSQFLVRVGKLESALWQLNQCLQKQPFEGMAWRVKAHVLVSLDRKEEAVDSLEQAISHGQRTKDTLLALSRLHEALGNKEKAEAYRLEAAPAR